MLTSIQYVRLIRNKIALSKENASLHRQLRRQRNTACAGLIGLTALSICSIASCRQKEAALFDARQEKANMKATAEYFQKDAADLASKNQDLKPYKDFVDSIEPFYPDMVDGKTEAEEKKIEQQTIAGQKKWDDACKTLGINPVELSRLKERE